MALRRTGRDMGQSQAVVAQSIRTWLGDQRVACSSPIWTNQYGGGLMAGHG